MKLLRTEGFQAGLFVLSSDRIPDETPWEQKPQRGVQGEGAN